MYICMYKEGIGCMEARRAWEVSTGERKGTGWRGKRKDAGGWEDACGEGGSGEYRKSTWNGKKGGAFGGGMHGGSTAIWNIIYERWETATMTAEQMVW